MTTDKAKNYELIRLLAAAHSLETTQSLNLCLRLDNGKNELTVASKLQRSALEGVQVICSDT